MPLRNGDHGYGLVTKTLHWATLLLMAVQFTIGYGMDADSEVDRVDDALDAQEESCESEDDAAEERCEEAVDAREDAAKEGEYAVFEGDLGLVDLHVVIGLLILALAIARTAWRFATPLPPWDERLSSLDRRLEHAAEVVLLTSQYVIPLSGLWLIAANDDSVLPLHIAGHVAFFAGLLLHLGVVLRRGTLRRML